VALTVLFASGFGGSFGFEFDWMPVNEYCLINISLIMQH
jgi:hypothetical protein